MHTGALGPVVMAGGLRFSDIIHEGTERWHQILGSTSSDASAGNPAAGVITQVIPADVSTIIVQKNDPLDTRLGQDSELSRELIRDFTEEFAAGSIRVLVRIK